MAGKYVKVLFDLDYKTHEGVAVSIREGEKCLLLKKTNADWWSVIKQGEKKPIYVPANYVEDIVPATSPKPIYAKKQPVPVQPKPKGNQPRSNGTVDKDSKVNEDVAKIKENDPKENEEKKEKDTGSDAKEDQDSKDTDNKSTDDNDDDNAEECDYVNVQELKKQFNSDGESQNQETEVADKKREHGLYEPAEYANLAAIQESIHARKQVSGNPRFLL